MPSPGSARTAGSKMGLGINESIGARPGATASINFLLNRVPEEFKTSKIILLR